MTVYSLALHVAINRLGSTRNGTAIGYKICPETKTKITSPGGESTAYCPSTLHFPTREHLTPYCLRAKRSSATVDANSTTVLRPGLKVPRDSAIADP